jgi:hypothetical protein
MRSNFGIPSDTGSHVAGKAFSASCDQTIDKTIVNDSRENETNKFGLGKPVVKPVVKCDL